VASPPAAATAALNPTATDLWSPKRAYAAGAWQTPVPIRITSRLSLPKWPRLQKLKFDWEAAYRCHLSSEYEHNVGKLLAEKKERLEQLMKTPENSKGEIAMLTLEIESLQSLFENYNLGMNVFRRAQGGRAGLRE
jgi:colicin import membrane protein